LPKTLSATSLASGEPLMMRRLSGKKQSHTFGAGASEVARRLGIGRASLYRLAGQQ
jgi:hypothetical protein